MKRKNKGQTGVASLFPDFAIVPTELAHDEEIDLRLKGLYAVLHVFCGTKNPNKGSVIWASQNKIGKKAKTAQSNVSNLVKRLEAVGWVTVVKTKREHTNVIILHGTKKQYISAELKRYFLKEIEERQNAYK